LLRATAPATPPIASGLHDASARLAEAFRDDPEKPAYVTYDPGTDLLPMINDAIGLLVPALRWQVTFGTYFTELPAGLICAWRCVVAGTPAASAARAGKGIALDLSGKANLGSNA
jgi:hypothetical protein